MIRNLIFLFVFLALVSGPAEGARRKAPSARYPVETKQLGKFGVVYRQAALRAQKSLVRIRSPRSLGNRGAGSLPFSDLAEDETGFFFAPPVDKEFEDLGTGVVFSKDGLILTSHEVVARGSRFLVSLDDDREFSATLLGSDPRTDLAVLQIKGSGFPAIWMADSTAVKLGDGVISLGASLAAYPSIRVGAVSGRSSSRLAEGLLQLDVDDPGMAGGLLLDLQGSLLGIHTGAFRAPEDAGFSYVVPISFAQRIIDDLKTFGHVKRGWIGVQYQPVSSQIMRQIGLSSRQGALVTRVFKDSPADSAGIMRGDVIVQFGKYAIRSVNDLTVRLDMSDPGTEEKIVVLRRTQRTEKEIKVLDTPKYQSFEDLARRSDGIGLIVSEDLKILEVAEGSPAEKAGLLAGDVIVSVQDQGVETLEMYEAWVREIESGEAVVFYVLRDEKGEYIGLSL